MRLLNIPINSSFLISLLLFICVITKAQKKPEYIVLDIPATIVKTKLSFLNVKDTINKNRTIYPVSDCLGGLSPMYPIAISYDHLSGSIYHYVSCLNKYHTLSGHCINYLIQKNDSITEITSTEQFKEIFAPVEDKEEALSFAYALCGNSDIRAIYDFSFLHEAGTDYEIFRKELKPTSVKELPDGYEVILFSTYWGHTAYCSEATIFVSKEGEVKVLKYESLFHDKNFNLIIE